MSTTLKSSKSKCKRGTHRNKETKKCVRKDGLVHCARGSRRNRRTGYCRKNKK